MSTLPPNCPKPNRSKPPRLPKPRFDRRELNAIADIIANVDLFESDRQALAQQFAKMLSKHNKRFDADRFVEDCEPLPINFGLVGLSGFSL